jgi:hypothetical protein
MLKFLPLAVCLAVTSTPALANDSAPKTPNDENKTVCKRVDGTGFRLARQKVCKTQAEWNAESREARDEIERSDRRDVS